MFSPSYPEALQRYRERRNEKEYLYPLFNQLKSLGFESSMNCLCIGAGPGEYDIEFVKRCLPSIKSVTVVEIDEYCIEEFKKNFAKAFDIKKIQLHTFLCPAQEWDSSEIAPGGFDVVSAFHVFSDVRPALKQEILNKIFKSFLSPAGVLVYNYILSRDIPGKFNTITAFSPYMEGDCNPVSECQNLNKEIEGYGVQIHFSKEYFCDVDYREFDFDLVPMFQVYRKDFTEETVKEMLATLPNKIGSYAVELCAAKFKSSAYKK